MPEVHPVELIAGKNEYILVRDIAEVLQVLAHRISRSLIPGVVSRCLLRGHDLDETMRKFIEMIALLNMSMQGGAVELRQEKNAFQPGIEAIADRDVDQAIFAC